MTKDEFRQLLTDAISGDSGSVERILELYKPLIERASFVDGRYDEDCRQYILMRLIDGIRKFKI